MSEIAGTDIIISRLDTANRALMEARTIQATKQVVDVATAAEVYAKRQKLGDEAIGYAVEIKVYALKKIGEMLRVTDRAKGGEQYHNGSTRSDSEQVPTLSKLGIEDRKVAMLARRVAELPQEELGAVAKLVKACVELGLLYVEDHKISGVKIDLKRTTSVLKKTTPLT